MREIWTTEAKKTFEENIKFLKKKWTLSDVHTFVEKTLDTIDLILLNPEIGTYDEDWKANKFLIVSQIYLFYIIENDAVLILSFWNNYQRPLGQ